MCADFDLTILHSSLLPRGQALWMLLGVGGGGMGCDDHVSGQEKSMAEKKEGGGMHGIVYMTMLYALPCSLGCVCVCQDLV